VLASRVGIGVVSRWFLNGAASRAIASAKSSQMRSALIRGTVSARSRMFHTRTDRSGRAGKVYLCRRVDNIFISNSHIEIVYYWINHVPSTRHQIVHK
jgi:hypothetical protein